MIKKMWNVCRNYLYWFIVLAISDILFIIFLWLVDAEGFVRLSCGLFLGTIGLFVVSILVVYKRDVKKEKFFLEFLEYPEQLQKEKALRFIKGREKDMLFIISSQLEEKDNTIKEQKQHIQEYQEYMEAWAHEIKTPLALMTFILDNRRDELAPPIYHRLEYIRSQMQEDIQRILYYGRLKAARTDYLFEKVSLKECISEVLKEYNILLQEHHFCITNEMKDYEVVTDRKGFSFLLSQIISNSIKYAKTDEINPCIHMYSGKDKHTGELILGIRDNGMGVKPYDIPFLFQKGFTGELGEERRNATGMGLYLANQIAEDLKIRLVVKEEYREGFEILLHFPIVEN